ncbi:MAG: GAF domain-containing protein [Desulfobacterales bacterium]|nr:GAF domain-containing protein [Desulfobacterales bacterium]
MNIKKRLQEVSIEKKNLRYRLPIIFAFFFFAPIIGFFYLSLNYNILEDKFIALFFIFFLTSSLFGFVLIRKIFDQVSTISKNIAENVAKEISGFHQPGVTNELNGIAQSFRAIEKELRTSHKLLNKQETQITTLKELSDLCYVTFDTEDILHLTLERALKMVNADIGSVLILEEPHREAFVVHSAFGLDEILKRGDRIDFATSIAKFAVINKSPLLVEDIEKDTRFGRESRPHYATKSFLCMPLKSIYDVFGVLTISPGKTGLPFTMEDANILAPLLSNAAFTYDNIRLTKKNGEKVQQIKTLENIFKLLNSSLQDSELFHALLSEFRGEVPFDLVLLMTRMENMPDRMSLLDFVAFAPTNLPLDPHYYFIGSVFDRVIKQESSLFIEDTSKLSHPMEEELLKKQGLKTVVLSPLKMEGGVIGVLAVGAIHPGILKGMEYQITWMAYTLTLAIEQNRLTSSIMKRDQEMEAIKQIGGILASSTFDMDKVLKHTMEMIEEIMDVEAGSLLFLDKNELEFKAAFNLDLEPLRSFRPKLGQGIAGYSADRGESVLIRDIQISQYYDPEFDRRTGFKTRSVLCVPLISQGKVIGAIEVLNRLQGDFDTNDLQLLQSIATSVSIAMENSRLYQETLSMAEHERAIRNMFQKFVPKEIVDKITYDSSGERPVVDELKTLTLLNIDIRNFSVLGSSIGPQKTVAILNHFFAVMGDIVFKYGGIVDKYLGDGFLAVFGAPISGISDADNAISAALEMKKNLAVINEYLYSEIEIALTIGISIHTGEAVVGNIGFDKKMDYTVIGDSVNIVFRLQELTKNRPNIILISEKTRRAVMNSILDVQETGKYNAGHVLGELKIYELLGQQGKPKVE